MMKVGHDRDLELRRGPGGSQQLRPRQGLPDGAGGECGGRDQEICQAIIIYLMLYIKHYEIHLCRDKLGKMREKELRRCSSAIIYKD